MKWPQFLETLLARLRSFSKISRHSEESSEDIDSSPEATATTSTASAESIATSKSEEVSTASSSLETDEIVFAAADEAQLAITPELLADADESKPKSLIELVTKNAEGQPVGPDEPFDADSEAVAGEITADSRTLQKNAEKDTSESAASSTDPQGSEKASSSSANETTAKTPAAPLPPPPPKNIVLIGAGHSHLQILTWWRKRPFPNATLTLVTAFDRAAYSAMLPSTLASMYPTEDMLIDLPQLCESCNVRLIVDRANRLDPEKRVIEFAHQPALSFDIASINIGSVPAEESLWQAHRILISVKPLSSFVQRFEVRFRELVEQWRMAPGPELLQIVVVGGGAAGVELALCLEQHKHELELPADVRIVDGQTDILNGFSSRTIRRVHKLLKQRGIDLSLGSPVVDCDDEGPSALVLASGERIRADLVIWAAGASPPMALRGFELPKTQRGFLAARQTLQSTADVPVFVSGDTADIEGFDIPKAGVHAVRQGPILWKNLRRSLIGKRLKVYRPQRRFLAILSCGDGTAVLDYLGFTSHSGWAWTLKKWIDTRWMRRFRVKKRSK